MEVSQSQITINFTVRAWDFKSRNKHTWK